MKIRLSRRRVGLVQNTIRQASKSKAKSQDETPRRRRVYKSGPHAGEKHLGSKRGISRLGYNDKVDISELGGGVFTHEHLVGQQILVKCVARRSYISVATGPVAEFDVDADNGLPYLKDASCSLEEA